jgi:hypothetical protein
MAQSHWKEWIIITLEELPGEIHTEYTDNAERRWMLSFKSHIPRGLHSQQAPQAPHKPRKPRKEPHTFWNNHYYNTPPTTPPHAYQINKPRKRKLKRKNTSRSTNKKHTQTKPKRKRRRFCSRIAQQSIKHLARLLNNNALYVHKLNPYSHKKLQNLYSTLATMQPTQTNSIILSIIKEQLASRIKPSDPMHSNLRQLFLNVPFLSREVDNIKFASFFKPSALTPLTDTLRTALTDTKIHFNYPPQLSSTLGNHARLRSLTDLDIEHIISSPCNCHNAQLQPFYNTHHKHVITTDPTLAPAPLRPLYQHLRSHRVFTSPINHKQLLSKLTQCIKSFSKHTTTRLNLPRSSINPWTQATITSLKYLIDELPDTPDETLELPDPALLQPFQDNFLITYVDKSAQHYVFLCKKFAIQLVQDEIIENETYTVTNSTDAEIISVLSDWMLNEGYESGKIPLKLGFLYPILKIHKNPFNFRFIAASVNVTLTPLSNNLNVILKSLMPHFHTLWKDTFVQNRLTPYDWWICNDATDIKKMIEKLNKRRKRQKHDTPFSTWDFSTLYTTLDQDDMINRICDLLDRIFNNQTEKPILHLHKDQVTWVKRKHKKKNYFYLDCCDLKRWLSFLIKNTFLQFGSKVIHQAIGIPMGTNCAVFLANLYLFSFELDFITTLINTKQITLLYAFARTKRYLDDIISADNPYFEKHRYLSLLRTGIYPEATLKLNAEQSELPIHFLDIQILYDQLSHNYYTTLWDKRYDSKYQALPSTRYPLITTALNRNSLYSIITGRLHALLHRTTRKKAFIEHLIRISARLINNNYNRKTILRKINRFLMKEQPLYQTTASTLQKDIESELDLFLNNPTPYTPPPQPKLHHKALAMPAPTHNNQPQHSNSHSLNPLTLFNSLNPLAPLFVIN